MFDVPPAAIGRFRVLHQVGAGASGPVFRAVHPQTDAPLAIKLFTLQVAPERAAAVAAELETLVSVMPVQDGACTLVEAGVHNATPYLVTSFADGDSLDVALKQFGPAAIADLLPRLRRLARAVDAAADAGVCHGALHPRDVLVSEISTVMTGIGTWPVLVRNGERLPVRRPYRAPELGEGTISAAGDRFALAALAYEWMTGRRTSATFGAGDMVPLANADREVLGQIFARALHTDPFARFESCAAFVDALATVEVEAPVLVEAPPPESRSRQRGRDAGPTLPLDVFPAEDDADLPLIPPPAPETITAHAPPDAPLHVRPLETAPIVMESEPPSVSPRVPPAAAATIRPQPAAEPPTPAVLRPKERWTPVPAAAPVARRRSGWGPLRLAAGLLLGAVIGAGAGFAVWGRESLSVRALADLIAPAAPSSDAPAAEPVPPSTTPPPEASANLAKGAGDAPVASGAPQGQAAPGITAAPSGDPPRAASEPANPPPSPPAAPTRSAPVGNLLVRSTPAGATVFVDDQRRGVTPLTLQNVELGTRRVRIQRDGYTAEERQIALTRSRPSRSLEVDLERAPLTRSTGTTSKPPAARTGTLVIESRPSGATIILNGRQVGSTPMTIDDLEPGFYTVQLQLETFRPISTIVRVVAGARARAAARLVSAQEPQ